MLRSIAKELKAHAPFTLLGALTGILIMVIIVFTGIPSKVSQFIFYIFHPLHVVLSALVTTAVYRHHRGKGWMAFLVGYVGSVGIATLSDAIFPYLGGTLLGAQMELHVGFIEKWWLVNPLAVMGIVVGYVWPKTRVPHLGHVLLSTWASLFYLTAFGVANWIALFPLVFIVLFLAVWIPCCTSDIVFPLLFVKE